MKILLDTNIILDTLEGRKPFSLLSDRILSFCIVGKHECGFSASTTTDIFYLYSKASSKEKANSALEYLLTTFDVVSITKADCLKALALPNEDFEDSLIEISAKNFGADYIVSRDEEFAKAATEVKVIKPDVFLAKFC